MSGCAPGGFRAPRCATGLLALVAALGFAAGPLAGDAEPKQGEDGTGAVERDLRAALSARAEVPVEAADCRPRRSSFRCSWSQSRTVAGWAYSCRGEATLRRGRWRIDPCRLAAETAPLRQPHDVIFGFNDDWGERSGKVDFASDAGAEVIRFPLGWNIVQPTFGPSNLLEALLDPGGSWDWSYYDRLYAAARRQGVRIVLSLQDAPCWTYQEADSCTEDAGGSPPDPEHLPAMATFLEEAIRRYPDAIAVEIYNEPNLSPYWVGRPDPEYYAQLLGVGYEATKAVRPDMPVLFAGLAPVKNGSETQMNFGEYFNRALAAGAAGKFDALSAHPYFKPFGRADYVERIGRHLAELKTIAFLHGEIEMPIWVTEAGVSTAGPGAVTEAEQAERTAGIYSSLKRIPGVEAVIVHRLFDTKGTGTNEDGWGLVRNDLRVKPAYCAIASLNERSPSRCGS